MEKVFLKIYSADVAPSISQMLSLFSRVNPAYIQISLKKSYENLQHLKKCNGTTW